MQTTTTTETATNPDAEIERAIASASAGLEGLRKGAEDADAEAQRWRTTFEREPTPEAHSNSAIYAQRAANARSEIARFETEELAPLIARRDAAQREREFAALESVIARLHEAADTLAVRAGMVVRALSDIPATMREFEALRHRSRAGISLQPAQLHTVLQRLNNALERQHGHIPGNPDLAIARVRYANQGPNGILLLEIDLFDRFPVPLTQGL